MSLKKPLAMEASSERENAFFSAAKSGDKETLKMLLQNHDIDVYRADKRGKTAMMMAADRGHADCIKCLVDANKTENINRQDNSGNTALMFASGRGHYDCVRYLVEAELTDVNLYDSQNTTALMLAAGNGHTACVEYLVKLVDILNIDDKNECEKTALMLAAERGHTGCVKCLIGSGLAKVNLCDRDGYTSLMLAANEGHYEIVKMLTRVKGINVDIGDKRGGRKALMLASCRGCTESVKYLIDTGLADVNSCDRDGCTALIIAAREGHSEIVKVLTGVEGIDINIRDKLYGRTALMLVSCKGCTESIKYLIDMGFADVNLCDRDGCTALMLAAKEGHYEIVKMLTGVDGISVDIRDNRHGRTALMFASERRCVESVKCLIGTGLCEVNLCDFMKRTAIIIAATEGHYEIIEMLAGVEGIDVNISDNKSKRTALMLASSSGYTESVKCLLDTGLCDINLCDLGGYSALMLAAMKGQHESVKILTEVERIDVNIKDTQLGRTALMLASCKGCTKSVKYLIDTGSSDVNLCDLDGCTALILAAREGHYESVKILTEVERIEVNITENKYGRTALMFASDRGCTESVKCLIATGLVNVNVCDLNLCTALMLAAKEGHLDIVKMLTEVEGIDVNVYDKWSERTALMLAAIEGHSKCIKCLLDRNDILINAQASHERTALMFASQKGHAECVKELLSSNTINVNMCDYLERNALMQACLNGHTQCVEALIRSKAEVNIHDHEGQTALMLAISNCKLECVKYLLSHKYVNVWERDDKGKTAFMLAAEMSDDRYLRCFVDITITEQVGKADVYGEQGQEHEVFTSVLSSQNSESSFRYLPGFAWIIPFVYNNKCDQNEKSVVNLVIRNGLCQCLTCFLLAYSDVPLYENHPCSHNLLDKTEICDCDKNGQTTLMIAAKHGNSECLEYLLQFERIRFHLVVMLMQKEFFVFGTISLVFHKRLCSLIRNHNDIVQVLSMMCSGEEIGTCVDYLLSAFICQMNSSGHSALSSVWHKEDAKNKSQFQLLIQHVSKKIHLDVHQEMFCLKKLGRASRLPYAIELAKADFFLWKHYPEFHGMENHLITRQLVARDFAPGLFEWQGKQSSPLYYAFMSGDHGLVRYLMVNLYMTSNDLEFFQSDTQKRECLRGVESEEIQRIYREHFEAPWRLERLSLLSLSISLREKKKQKDVDKLLGGLPEIFRSRLPFRNPMRMICLPQWEKINLGCLTQRLSASQSDEDLFHGKCCDGGCLQFERRYYETNFDVDWGLLHSDCNTHFFNSYDPSLPRLVTRVPELFQ